MIDTFPGKKQPIEIAGEEIAVVADLSPGSFLGEYSPATGFVTLSLQNKEILNASTGKVENLLYKLSELI